MWNIELTLGRSLIYIKKGNGPKIELCGRSIDTDFVSDLASW